MSEITNSEGTSALSEKPAILTRLLNNEVKFPAFPEPTEEEFEEDIGDDERAYYRKKFFDLDIVKTMKLHCSACDRHLGSSTRNESRMRAHPMLRTLVCQTCHTFYNSGEFEKGDDGSELYCRWCGQGGQVYCCSDCPHVFCAKCIKRNLGVQKIKEIENTDDWKCFKCNPRCLWDLRAICWALLRYCDLKNKITYKTEDASLKEAYQKDCAIDFSDCCKNKSNRKREKIEPVKKKEDKKMTTASAIAKISSAIQVKKFASINLDEPVKEKKAPKRHHMNDKVLYIKNPIAIAPQVAVSPVGTPPAKKPRMPVMNPVRFAQDRKPVQNTYARIRPKLTAMPIPIVPQSYNGFNINNSYQNFGNVVSNDTLNLSLESLTQGLDMCAVAAMSSGNQNQDDDVVCTPDFPLEPLCEVTEDNTDDDVQCITPGPVVTPKIPVPPLVPRLETTLPDLSADNIVQMTDNDVTVNTLTGGLKFRVDPQTLSSNKMYRLPDGRIFAIKANPNMPGGYSATIVAVTETGNAKSAPKGATYAAKLSAVTSSQTSTISKTSRSNTSNIVSNTKRCTPTILRSSKVTRGTDTATRECDLQVPIEWYRYNLVDAVDALEYTLSRLNKLKKEATCRFLRTRTVDEMKGLHRTLDRLLNTSATRFHEIKDNLNKELKQYITKKTGGVVSDDDDDVEILPDLDDNDDPIFIDENSMESNSNDLLCNESSEVDLTGVGSSDHNDSAEIVSDNISIIDKDVDKDVANDNNGPNSKNLNADSSNTPCNSDNVKEVDSNDHDPANVINDSNRLVKDELTTKNSQEEQESNDTENNKPNEDIDSKKDNEDDSDKKETDCDTKDNDTDKGGNDLGNDCGILENDGLKTENRDEKKLNGDTEDIKVENEKNMLPDDNANQENDGKQEDSEMSEEMIETLLKDDNADDVDKIGKNTMKAVESL